MPPASRGQVTDVSLSIAPPNASGPGPSHGEGSSRARLGDDGCEAGEPLALVARDIERDLAWTGDPLA